jgi:hypothetical protein
MIQRKWLGYDGYYFCGHPETNDQLLYECPVAKAIWGLIAICFHQNTRPELL